MTYWQLTKINLLMIFRNRNALFWNLVIPALLYIGLSLLPIGLILGNTSYSSFLLPGLIALMIMQGGIYTLAYWMTDIKNRGIIRQLAVTPVRKTALILSLMTARSITMILQALLLTLIGTIFFRVQINGALIWIPILVILGGFVFLPIGLLISTFAKSYDAASPLTAAIGLPLTFLGNVFYPIHFLPQSLQIIAKYLPITFLADSLRQVYLSNPTFQDLAYNLYWLLIWIIAIAGLTIWRFKLEE
ncbi:MAG: hypothetical protein A3B10_02180 [Candidatus Doudnabacteria bacterium RIFCSPLOWO2_01_FULL_44_21]|uniref:Transport permease protein n=1 Tax=Candidatus Doudnabacteria bacterium RIFCSPLOWO2_01_FULL_44_21 TaxID=1817841 RepID=A0A1F5Q6D6_9BACT|nr:MAG: hypothetical protein A3B95_01120 [Candidatus Doudnabacteria bacterium RIFCSPHIGHO2_02_FULL_43_13b]OGE97380.1 MAG: hypothetical protein A3B10_02180 [Candidatus Doudnabacteria bacterium RIFCSPLOWO2_01_FULL_44_21]